MRTQKEWNDDFLNGSLRLLINNAVREVCLYAHDACEDITPKQSLHEWCLLVYEGSTGKMPVLSTLTEDSKITFGAPDLPGTLTIPLN